MTFVREYNIILIYTRMSFLTLVLYLLISCNLKLYISTTKYSLKTHELYTYRYCHRRYNMYKIYYMYS